MEELAQGAQGSIPGRAEPLGWLERGMQGWDANCRWMWICSTVSLPEEGEGFGVSSSPPKPAEVWRTTPPPAPRNIQARPASRQKSCEQAADPRETLPPIIPARREARREQGRARPAPSTPKLWHFPPVRAAARFHGDPGAGSGAWDAPERLRLAHAAPTPSLPARLQPTLALPVTVTPGFGARRSLSAPTPRVLL